MHYTVKTKVCITYFFGMFFLLTPCIPFFGMLCILLIYWYVMHTHKGMKCKLEIYLKLQEIHLNINSSFLLGTTTSSATLHSTPFVTFFKLTVSNYHPV